LCTDGRIIHLPLMQRTNSPTTGISQE